MIQLKLIPDGVASIPLTAQSHKRLWNAIKENSTEDDRQKFATESPVGGIKDIIKVIPANNEYIIIRLPGDVDEYPDDLLDSIPGFFTAEISGVKAHPDGWQYVDPDR